ncbi:DUF4344 domain-containing metallopeptidase [Seongchinamella sediminis]|uniref:DUF4344 domain-containing metallopeptidase n=1 Tax=Seongchinamella sediminis TaxID=2283635 RepID=UPI0013C2A55E|nr:DUF4344 domain-containing metallopeptidase [Seongchinamella sediminis]
MENVQVGTQLELQFKVEKPLQVWVLDLANLARFPDVAQALHSQRVADEDSVTLVPPASDDYYVLFDNRDGPDEVDVEVAVRISRAELRPLDRPELQRAMNRIVASLNKIFIFDSIDVQPAACGVANLLTVDKRIYLCLEYVSAIEAAVDEREQAKALLLFALLHEFAHVLLRQWEMPFYDNEEIADQMATALTTMIERDDAAMAQARFFAAAAVAQQQNPGSFGHGRHPLAAQRARNIQRWSEAGDEHARAWQPFLVPRMQSAFLRQLSARTAPWVRPELVGEELRRREEANK